MTYSPISTPRGHVIFCDDVRQENTGKLLYIGVYVDALVIHSEFPATIPALNFIITYIERPGESTEPVRFVIRSTWDEEEKPLAEINFPVEDFRNLEFNVSGLEDAQQAASVIVALPLQVPRPGIITVYAERGAQEFRLGRLPILSGRQSVISTIMSEPTADVATSQGQPEPASS